MNLAGPRHFNRRGIGIEKGGPVNLVGPRGFNLRRGREKGGPVNLARPRLFNQRWMGGEGVQVHLACGARHFNRRGGGGIGDPADCVGKEILLIWSQVGPHRFDRKASGERGSVNLAGPCRFNWRGSGERRAG